MGARSSLVGNLALLAALALALALTAGDGNEVRPTASATGAQAAGPGTAAGPQLDSERLAKLAVSLTPEVARRVERIRELEFERIPRPQLADSAHLRRLTSRELSRPRAARALRTDEAALRLLGLIEPDAELAEIASDFTSLAAAFYDPEKDELFVVSDAVPAGPAVVEFVLAHELVHALEDQRFGLPDAGEGASDERALAQSALVEGTATAIMSEYALRHLDASELANDAAAIVEPATELPAFLESQTTFSYFGGQAFVEELYARTASWALVDRALAERPPITSEQILHPVEYLLGEGPQPVRPPPDPGPRWRQLDDDVFGEFLTAELLRVASSPVPGSASAGWAGDRYRFWQRRGAGSDCAAPCRSGYALAVGWRWDTPADAREFRATVTEYVESGLGGERRGAGGWELDGGWAAIGAEADTVVRLGLAPDEATAKRIAGG